MAEAGRVGGRQLPQSVLRQAGTEEARMQEAHTEEAPWRRLSLSGGLWPSYEWQESWLGGEEFTGLND